MTHERAVRAADIEQYRQALTELGGEATLEQLAEYAGTGETETGYIAACLIVPDTERVKPFAIPSASGRDALGRRLWRSEEHWTAANLEEARRFLGPLPGGGGREGDES